MAEVQGLCEELDIMLARTMDSVDSMGTYPSSLARKVRGGVTMNEIAARGVLGSDTVSNWIYVARRRLATQLAH